jgi:hypothetical protein
MLDYDRGIHRQLYLEQKERHRIRDIVNVPNPPPCLCYAYLGAFIDQWMRNRDEYYRRTGHKYSGWIEQDIQYHGPEYGDWND